MKKWLKKKYYPLYFEIKYVYSQILLFFNSSKKEISQKYKSKFGVAPNLNNPIGYNEKLLWLMLNWNDNKAKICADKYLVRDYVAQKVGTHILNEMYMLVDSVKDINFDALPNQFVLKSTQGSGMNFICTDKNKITKKEICNRTYGYTRKNYFYSLGREYVYKDMTPKIIVEKFLGKNKDVPKDYKFYCFGGKPEIIQVDIDRFKEGHRENFYDVQWNLLDVQDLDCPSDPSQKEAKPKELDDMLEYASVLSAGFPHVRVDFYVFDSKIIFGEMTFFTACGMTNWEPKEYDVVLGAKLKLPF